MTIPLSHIKHDETGLIDVDASCDAYRAALTAWKASVEVELADIQAAVDKLMRLAGKSEDGTPNRTAMATLKGMAMLDLQPTPDEYTAMTARVEDFIKANSINATVPEDAAEAAARAEALPRFRYLSQKGKSGGYSVNPAFVEPETDDDTDADDGDDNE